MSGHDERCPHCGVKMNDLQGKWQDQSGHGEFITDCIACEKPVLVDVMVVPEFFTGPTRCQWCRSTDVVGLMPYCERCKDKLNALSQFNEMRDANAEPT
jgi:hypothetical protein